jgi:riboflavin kinase/FMN adenylyltransferase
MGDRRGRELGFPTANVRIGADVELADGVYAGAVELADGSRYSAAISVGRRPTYYEAGERLLEAYLLGFDRDIYGESIRVLVGELLRGQGVYGSQDDLVKQIADDVEAVRSREL